MPYARATISHICFTGCARYGKIGRVQRYSNKPPISVLAALSTGFDTVTRQLWLLVLPVGLDLFLWLGPRLKAASLWRLLSFDIPAGLDAQTRLVAQQLQDTLREAFESFNWFVWLRPALFGVPGLVSGVEPGGLASQTRFEGQVNDPALLLGIVLLLAAIGIGLGGLYWSLIARQARDGRIDWGAALGRMPVVWSRLIGLAVLLIGLALVVWLPTTLIGLALGSAVDFLGALVFLSALMLLMWLLFYATFSIHGIVLYNQPVVNAVRASVWLVRTHVGSVFGLLIAFVAIDLGMRLIWSLAPIDSWLWAAAIGGNAFVVAGLSMATMVFYLDRVPMPGSALMPQQTQSV